MMSTHPPLTRNPMGSTGRRPALLRFVLLFLLGLGAAHGAEPVRVGIYENPPKIFHDYSGKPAGFFVDILNNVAENEGWQLDYVPCRWEQCLIQLQQGEIDLLPDVAYSRERSRFLEFNREIVLSNWSMLYAREPQRYNTILDLQGVRIAVLRNSIQYQALRRRSAEFNVEPVYVETASPEAMLEAIADGGADAVLLNRLHGLSSAQDYRLQPTHILVEASNLHFASAAGRDTELLAAIDRQLAQLKTRRDSAYHRAMQRWIAPLEQQQHSPYLLWAIQGLILLSLLFAISILALKHLVKKRTAELQQTNNDLARSEELTRRIFEAAQDAMLLADDRRIIEANPAMLKMFRYPDKQTLRSLEPGDFFPPMQPGGERSIDLYTHRLAEAEEHGVIHFEWYYRRGDGLTFPAEVTLVSLQEEGRRLFQATIRDITRRKNTEQELHRLNRAMQTLSKVNHILVHSRDEEALLDDICRAIIQSGGYQLVWVGFAQLDDARSVKPVAQYGFKDGYLEQIRISWENNEHGQGPTGQAIRNGKPAMVRDIHNDPRYEPWRNAALEYGYASSIALPLTDKGQTFGALNIYSSEPDAFSDKEVSLLTELSDDLAFGIRSHRLRLEQTDIEEERQGHRLRLQQSLLQTIQAITIMVEKRDPFTAGHQRRVADLAMRIGQELGLDAVRLEGLRFGGMIHDIGNIYVPAEILNRPGKLSESEIGIIRSHPVVGYDIVKDIDFPWPVADMILHHHERLDGSGYPDGLEGEAITLYARIIGVADVVEAMLSHRPYRPKFSTEEVLAELESHRGSRYDPRIVDAIIRLFREEGYTLLV